MWPWKPQRSSDGASSLEREGPGRSSYSSTIPFLSRFTKTCNRFHDPQEKSADIVRLRELHHEMDEAVAKVYGWDDLELEYSFHETKQGLWFTISENARREVLGRLLRLNHERYAEEVAQGLHEKGAKADTMPIVV